MTSQYLENHREELEKILDRYKKSDDKIDQYRANCIEELIRWEEVKSNENVNIEE